MLIIGNLRKRWVLGAIFLTSLVYFVYNTQISSRKLSSNSAFMQKSSNYEIAENILRKLKWHGPSKLQANETELDDLEKSRCRNSLQGRDIIADEEGYICKRQDTKSSGCCDTYSANTNRYVCDACLSSHCCSVYEHCVSCCMKPDKRKLLEKIIRESVSNLQQMVFATIDDQFDLCLTKCRTSSNSVQHENTYRDSKFKYCYGRRVPEIRFS